MNKEYIIHGYHIIISLLYNNIYKFKKIYYNKECENNRLKKILYNLRYSKIKIIPKNKNFLKKKFNIKNPNIIAKIIYKKNLYNIEWLILNKSNIFIVFLDNLTDINNLTYCIRSSNASEVNCIILRDEKFIKNQFKFLNNSLGSITPIIYIKNIKKFFLKLKKLGFIIICTKDSSNINLYEINFKKNIIFIFGSENRGIKKNLINKICNYNIYIPMKGNVKNLNVSNACSLCLYEKLRQKYY